MSEMLTVAQEGASDLIARCEQACRLAKLAIESAELERGRSANACSLAFEIRLVSRHRTALHRHAEPNRHWPAILPPLWRARS